MITGAVLRLFPATPRHATAWVAVPSVAAAVSLLAVRAAARRRAPLDVRDRQPAGARPRARPPARRARPARPSRATWYVLVELAGAATDDGLDDALEAILGAAVEADLAADAAIAGSPAQRAALWALREGISEAQKVEGATLKHDVTLPIAALAAWADAIGPRLEAVLPGVRPVTYGHVGDGNLHYNLSAPVGAATTTSAPRPPTSSTAIYDSVAAADGSHQRRARPRPDEGARQRRRTSPRSRST